MDNPLTYLGAGILLALVVWLLRRHDQRDRDRRERWRTEIADTRDQLLDILALVEAVGDGDTASAVMVVQRYYANRRPAARPELVADPELVDMLCTTLPEVLDRGWGRSHGGAWSIRLGDAGARIRDAMRAQLERVDSGHAPLTSTPEQRQRLNETQESIARMIAERWPEREEGGGGHPEPAR